jgi:hypothetical protein
LAIGRLPSGSKRYIANIVGGSFFGDRLRGNVMNGGADWLTMRPDGFAHLDIRITLQTDDGALIYVASLGLLAPATPADELSGLPAKPVTMRKFMSFEAGAERYFWLNSVVAVGRGEVGPDGIRYEVFELV